MIAVVDSISLVVSITLLKRDKTRGTGVVSTQQIQTIIQLEAKGRKIVNAGGSISKLPILEGPVKIHMNQTAATNTMIENERLHVQIDAVELEETVTTRH